MKNLRQLALISVGFTLASLLAGCSCCSAGKDAKAAPAKPAAAAPAAAAPAAK